MAFTISQSSFSIYPTPFDWLQLYSFAQIWWASLKHVWLMEEMPVCEAVRKRLFIWNLKSFILWKAWWKDDDVCQLGLPFALYPKKDLPGQRMSYASERQRKWERNKMKARESGEKEFITVYANEMFPPYNSLSLSALIKEEA